MSRVPAATRRASAQVLEELTRLELLAAFSDSGVITPVSLDLTPVFKEADLVSEQGQLAALEVYTQLGSFFGRVHRSAKWWIADWLNWGEGAFGERYAQAADATGLSIPYLMNIAWVGRNVFPSVRRDGVSFSLHAEVAKLTRDEQTRWLDEAIEREWASKDLRAAIKAEQNGGVHDDDDGDSDDDDRERRPLNAQRIYETAKAVAAQARRRGSVYEVPVEQFDQLLAAIGRGE